MHSKCALFEISMHSKITAHISLNGSHYLAAGFLVYRTHKVSKEPGYYMIVLF